MRVSADQFFASRPALLRRACAAASVVIAALAIAACGSSSTGGSGSGQAESLLKQTFAGAHPVKSGVLTLTVTITPSGSSTLTTPITLSLGGPFQSRGSGQLPQSSFTLGISALGRHGSLGVISTGTTGYVTLSGTSYQLPASDFQRLESSISPTGSKGGLAGLGIKPQGWLTNPKVIGNDTVAGAPTTHIRSGVNVTALISDLNTFLAKASKASSSTQLPTSIPPTTVHKIAAAARNATVDIWTGQSDKTLRKLALGLTLPVTGQVASAFGGLKQAAITVGFQYSKLNQPQTITAPTSVKPYSEFTSKIRGLLSGVQGSIGSSPGATGSPGSSGGSGSGASSKVQKYSACIQSAGQDVSKMQKCASILNGQ